MEERAHLTRKERALWNVLRSAPGKAFSRRELIERVWGPGVAITAQTVDVHVGRLRRKLSLTLKGAVVETVWGIGYRLRLPSTTGEQRKDGCEAR